MRTYNFDEILREISGLGENVMNSPFFVNLQKMYENGVAGDGKCDCGPSCACDDNVVGLLHARVKTYDDKYVLIAEVPGLSDENITVEFKDGLLTLKAKYEKQEDTDFNSLRVGTYVATFKSKDADGENISAKMDKGQVMVTLPKKAEAQPIKVQINRG